MSTLHNLHFAPVVARRSHFKLPQQMAALEAQLAAGGRNANGRARSSQLARIETKSAPACFRVNRRQI
jgi:hypothetical protein